MEDGEITSYFIKFLVFISGLVFANGMLLNFIYSIQLWLSFRTLQKRTVTASPITTWWRINNYTSPMSILVPAYNEAETIADSVHSMLSLHYPNFEIIVINDGSKDHTLKILIEEFGLKASVRTFEKAVEHNLIHKIYSSKRFPRLTVVDKENGGKADALNAGINLSRFPLFCAVDADSVLESDALLRSVEPFVEDPERVVAVGGTIRIANGSNVVNGRVKSIGLPKSILPLFQIVEYLRAFLMARLAWSEMNAMMLISGAFGIFKRSVVLEVGGYSRDTVGEDMEIIVKLHRYLREQGRDYEIRFVPEPVCWTEAPESLAVLGSQRKRWQRGTLETFFKHKHMLGRKEYGVAGTIGFPNILFSDVIGPMLELFGYILMPILYWFGIISWSFFFSYLALIFAFGIFISVGSLVLEEIELRRFPSPLDLVKLTAIAVLENFGYRQLNNYWRFVGCIEFLRGKKHWGHMTRKGFSNKS